MDKEKYKILITGGSGLIGSHLINELSKLPYELYLTGRNKRAEWSADNINFIAIDFSEDWDVKTLPKEIDIIIHLSQSEHFRNFPDKALDVFYVNTLSTLKLVNYALNAKCKKIIYASSAGIYGNSNAGFNEEQEIVYKTDLGFYLASKHCSEVILDNYSNLLDISVLRFFFVYGKGQRKDMLIPRLVNNVKTGNPITLQGSEGIKINPTHVSVAVAAILKIMEVKGSHKFNISGDEVLSLKEIGDIIGKQLSISPNYSIIDQEPKHLIGDNAKMKSILNTISVPFEKGILDLLEDSRD